MSTQISFLQQSVSLYPKQIGPLLDTLEMTIRALALKMCRATRDATALNTWVHYFGNHNNGINTILQTKNCFWDVSIEICWWI